MEDLRLAYLLLPFLGWNTLTDLKDRKISFLSVLLFGAAGFALLFPTAGKELLLQNGSVLMHVLGMCFGLMLLLLSFGTGGAVGAGDALIGMVLGWYLGIYRIVLLFLLTFLAAGLAGGFLLLIKKAGRKSKLPMLPFLLFSYLLLLGAGLI